MQENGWVDNLAEDYRVTRKLYYFPNCGTQRYNLLGPPVRVKTYQYDAPQQEDPGYGDLGHFCLIQTTNFVAAEVSFDISPLGFAFSSYLQMSPSISGGRRPFHAFFQSYGSVVPASSATVAEALKTGGEITQAISAGPGGIVAYLLGLVSGNVSVGRITNQPFPSHHIGVLKIEEMLEGIVLEGGARASRMGTYSAARVKSVCHVYTDAYLEYLTTAWAKWVDFYNLGSYQRQNQLASFQGYLRARQDWFQRKREGRLDPIMDDMREPPNPLQHQTVNDWFMWAWERGLDVTSPPPDPRRSPYNPNFNYDRTRSWYTP